MRKRIVIAAATLLLVGLGCGGRKVRFDEQEYKAEAKGVISLWAEWIKDKDDKFDARLHIRNESSDHIIVLLRDMTCGRGDRHGTLKHTFFNTGERTMDFGPGEEKDFNVVCKFSSDVRTG